MPRCNYAERLCEIDLKREIERQTYVQTEKDKVRETKRQRETKIDKETDKYTDRGTSGQRDREGQRHTEMRIVTDIESERKKGRGKKDTKKLRM